jgi:outer membrane scaffolding protein for murein synthesis (MipA/OmpV family)
MDNRIHPILPTRRRMRLALPITALLLALPLPAPAADGVPAVGPEAPATPDTPDVPGPQARWEGAIGVNASHGATYQGGDQVKTRLHPGFFLRYGRFTVTNSSGYVTRRADDVFRGLGVDLSNNDRLRVNLALRFDAGRSESTDPALNGLGDIRPTVRARLSASERLADGWRLGASWSVDAFGRGGGNFGDVSFGRELRWSADTVWGWGASLSAAGDRYMQTYFGISDDQAARTGYPVYTPGSGLRDVSVFANLRTELSPRWLALASVSASRLLGPAAGSPLTKQVNGWGVTGGVAWRF